MPKSVPSSSTPTEPVAAPEPVAAEAEADAPLNRIDRRAKLKQAIPSHVGPRGGFARQSGGGPRSASKRPV